MSSARGFLRRRSASSGRGKTIGFVLGSIVFLALYLIPLPLPPKQQTLATLLGASHGFMLPVSTPPNASSTAPAICVLFDIIGVILIVAGVTVMAQFVGLA